MSTIYLSEDVAAMWPYAFAPEYDILRQHEEEVRTGLFGWRKEKVTIIDHIRLTGIKIFTVSGESWTLPLSESVGEQVG